MASPITTPIGPSPVVAWGLTNEATSYVPSTVPSLSQTCHVSASQSTFATKQTSSPKATSCLGRSIPKPTSGSVPAAVPSLVHSQKPCPSTPPAKNNRSPVVARKYGSPSQTILVPSTVPLV